MTQEDCAVQGALRYIREGMSPEAAIERACRECAPGLGLGQDLLQAAQADVANISAAVSPWLWILSVGGFLMAVLNKHQISQMYGSWKRMKRELLG